MNKFLGYVCFPKNLKENARKKKDSKNMNKNKK